MLEKRYNPQIVEEGKYKSWKEKGYFLSGDKTKSKFSMVIPPPNVTGKLHLGHAFNTTVQDIIARYKKAKGFDVLWLPGMDHAGIATQAKVDEKLRKEGISRYDLGREKFLEVAWEWKYEYAHHIHDQWEKMGIMVDYSKERFTLDSDLNKAVNHVFKTLYDKGLIYRGERIINWDPVQRTALSNIEVIYKEDEGDFFYFKYKVVGTDDYLIVATTRPETMFGDVCLNVNPKDDRFKKYHGMKAINPANGDELVIIPDEYVDISFGTGVMKCTPAHDPNDYIIGKKYNLPLINVMNDDATMNELAGPDYVGLDRFACREKLVKKIEADGNLVKIEKIKHNVGHSERSDAVVEPYLSKQWFVKMRPLADAAIALQNSKDAIEFMPKRFNKAFIQWMEKIEDWCISRQLWWGHRIPAYYHKTTGELLVSETAPVDIENWRQDEDVLDTWFSSGLWPFSTLGWPKNTEDLQRYYPIDVMVTAYDILFFWVSRMIMQGIEFTGKRPFDKVLLHGLIRDNLGRKMSKSLGNGVDPLDIIATYGVDALRYFLATSSSPGLDLRFSTEKVEASANFLNKVWNSARFILLNCEDIDMNAEINTKELNIFDKYIIGKFNETIKNVTKNMDKYELGNAATYLYNFVYDDFCSFYIESTKSYLKNEHANVTKKVLIHVLKGILTMIYPYSPFIAEEIYTKLNGAKESIMLETYPIYNAHRLFKKEIEVVELLKSMIKDIRNYKVNNHIAPSKEITVFIKGIELTNDFVEGLQSLTNVKVELKEDAMNTSFIYSGVELIIYDDSSKEDQIKQLQEMLEKTEFEINRATKMLNNENFVKKANPQKVQDEKDKLAKFLEQKENILKNLKKFW